MKLLLTHIADPDGITPIILLNLLNEDFEYKLFEVSELSNFILENIDTNYFDKYDQIYITDLGMNDEAACSIMNSKYKNIFKLFDHHETHYYLNKYEFAKVIEEEENIKECGTSLFYNYLKKEYANEILDKKSVFKFVELVRENDTWQFTYYKDESKDLSTLFSFYGKDTYIKIYTDYLKNNNIFKFNQTELIILESLNLQKKDYIESYKNQVIIKIINGYKVGIVFAEQYRSELGNYLSEEYKEQVDFICILNLARHASLRGIKSDKPVNVFASIYGGGGHPLAAAFQFKEDLKDKIIDLIFN